MFMLSSQAIHRVRRGIQADWKRYLATIVSLSVAFLCLSSALLVLQNLSALSARWNDGRRATLILTEDADEEDILTIEQLLASTAGVAAFDKVTPEGAKTGLLSALGKNSGLEDAPVSIFPTSYSVRFQHLLDHDAHLALLKVFAKLPAVEAVESYDELRNDVRQAFVLARLVSALLGGLVGLAVLAIIANTMRLTFVNRSREIEVLRLSGATPAYTRAPFVVEGMLQGLLSAALALVLLFAFFLWNGQALNTWVMSVLGQPVAFLSPLLSLGMLASGALLGTLAGWLSVRGYWVAS